MDKLWRLRNFSSQFAMMILMCLMTFQFVRLCWSRGGSGPSLLSDPTGALLNGKNVYGLNDLWNIVETKGALSRRLLRVVASHSRNSRNDEGFPPAPSPSLLSSSPSQSPSSEFLPSSPSPSQSVERPVSSSFPRPDSSFTAPTTSAISPSGQVSSSSSSKHKAATVFGAAGGFVVIVISVVGIIFCRSNRVVTVIPWATGLSGQLQKALVTTGVPKLRRLELETACEDFSNVVGTSPVGTVYKGTLSNGVEIAVISVAVTSSKDWKKNIEAQFRKKIKTLSKVKHKNFANLLGYCEEDEPFTRMLVFEYAPNGTLFEHLHIKEAENLDWSARLRIAMGVAYCLEHMHQLTPPVAHNNLNSSVVNLTEDYAAKISDFSLGNGLAAAETVSPRFNLNNTQLSRPQDNVYSFGLILFEMITGRFPDSLISGYRSLKEVLDPSLDFFKEEQLEGIGEVIESCLRPDPLQRPTMREVAAILREITAMGPDGAIPKLSPLWWAELEILSTEAS